MNEQQLDYVYRLVKEQLRINFEIEHDADLILLGLDSIKTVNLIVCLEDFFDITFEDHELFVSNFSSISKVVSIIEQKVERLC
ncbi:phosphopantetheine-binding protein [Paenibacillus glucanolyticus]|uniref:phosphopantetheine-binding protein n=1 Tax=Paenibacillus glucanolyticus TaxID=59843 RepID=UPI0036987316